ncbi:MAG: type III-A CRISPR-associated protein Csm2 [Planctomycetes bacterium]|nr:type III-A CRISPR-associated protein Csm2 [Planctomycetota bacterium]
MTTHRPAPYSPYNDHSRQSAGGMRDDNRRCSMADIWSGYLDGGYFDPGGNLRPDYVTRDRIMPVVQQLARENLTAHQMRRFFQHCRALEAALLRAKPDSSWPQQRTNLMRLDVAAQDAFGKSPPKIPSLFHDFIRRNVGATKTEKDFLQGFLPHFEALVGFSSGVLKESERR